MNGLRTFVGFVVLASASIAVTLFIGHRMANTAAAEPVAVEDNATPETKDAPTPSHFTTGMSPGRGAADSRVTIIEYGDFECPFCVKAEPTLRALLSKYQGRVRLVWKNNPLKFHPHADGAARAALAADGQGKFWEMHDLLLDNRGALSDDRYLALAMDLGLDMTKFRSDEGSSRIRNLVEDDTRDAIKAGASGTPTFFINGEKLTGAQPQADFERLIDAALLNK